MSESLPSANVTSTAAENDSNQLETIVVTANLEQATEVLRRHEEKNMCKYAIYNCRKDFGHTDFRTRKHHVHWKDKYIRFTGIPYFVVNRRNHDCHLGKDRRSVKSKEKKESITENEQVFPRKRKNQPETKKMDCPAQVYMIEIIQFPDYRIPIDSSMYLRTTISCSLRDALQQKKVNIKYRRRIIVVLPDISLHKGHGICEYDHHEAIGCISWLIGTWTGKGSGKYPTIKNFSYLEDITFEQFGQPMLNYRSFTRHHLTLKPMHQEVGYLKVKPGTAELAFCVAQNTGIVEVEEGSVSDTHQIDLKSSSIGRASFGKEPYVQEVTRQYKLLDDNRLEMTMHMETSTHKKSKHLHIIYTRKEAS